jgi:hypothetical protein
MSNELNALSIVESININQMGDFTKKIEQFQKLVQSQLRQDHDYGIIPYTKKPTLLKPGAEKINMLMGLTSAFDIIESTRDFDKGFFQYQVKCMLMKNGVVITEGLGTCNTKEKKYVDQDPYSVDNTVLKMSKKRAFIDATLLVGSLSDIFTQDLEDVDLAGNKVSETKRYATDNDGTISNAQAKRMFALAKGNADLVKEVMAEAGYTEERRSNEVKKIHYEEICKKIEERANAKEE